MNDESRVWIGKRTCKSGRTTYHLRWIDPQARRWRSRKVGTDCKRAAREATLLERQLDEGTYREIRRTTWADFSAEHVGWIAGDLHRKAATRILAEFGEMFPVEPTRITFAMIEEYSAAMATKGNSVATINMKLRYLRAAFRKAVKRGYLAQSPMEGWTWAKVDKKAMRILADDEEPALLDAADEVGGLQLRAFVCAALNTGGRRAELLGLPWDRVDLDGEAVTFTKTKGKRDRTVPIVDTPELVSMLRRLQAQTLQDGGSFVGLTSAIGSHWTWVRVIHKAGIRHVTIHDLRRTYVTRLIRAGVPLPTVQELSGHANIQTTLTYYNEVSDGDKRAAVRAMRRARMA